MENQGEGVEGFSYVTRLQIRAHYVRQAALLASFLGSSPA